MWIYYICALPLLLALVWFVLSGDLLNIRKLFYISYLTAALSFLAGLALFYLKPFGADAYPGLILLIFSIALIYLSCFEILRLIYRRFRKEDPCITNWSSLPGRHPSGALFSEYPAGKKVSIPDYLFSVTQCVIPLVIVFVLILVTLIDRW